MRSLYYIAPKKNLERFDALFEEADILATPFQAESIRSLTAFIKGDRGIAQQNYIVIDVEDLQRWSVGHVLSAVQQLCSFASIKLIFLGQPCEDVDELFRILRDTHHIDGAILDTENGEISTELAGCLAAAPEREDGVALSPAEKLAAASSVARSASRARLRQYTPAPGRTIRFAVAGTLPRCGATTQAFGLYHYLSAAGLTGAIEDRAGTLPLLSQFEASAETKHGGRSFRGVCFIEPGGNTGSYDFVVTDYGVLGAETAAAFCKADVSVLAGCTKPWELPAFAEAVKLLFGYSCRLVTIASFSTDADLLKLTRYLGEYCAAAPWQPDVWRLANGAFYEKLFSPALDELCAGYAMDEGELDYG